MRRRSTRGQGLTEAVAAAVVIIPLALCLLDFMVLIIANSMNDTIVKNAARAGASQDSEIDALAAAKKSIASFHSSNLVQSNQLVLSGFNYDPNKGSISAQTTMTVNLPMPFPGYSTMTFTAVDVEPIVNFQPPP